MTLAVSVRKTLGDFRLDVAFESTSPVTALFGHSGAGKTSLVEIIAGLARPDSGSVRVGETALVDISQRRFVPAKLRRVGYVFQDARLFPHMSVRGNLDYGRRAAPEPERWAQLGPITELLGIGGLLDRRPRSLSGGEAQRVAIGRALMASPRILLMDEPLASIDQSRRDEILPYLDRLRAEMAIPIVYVSHSAEEIARIADNVVVLDKGRVVAVQPAAELFARLDLPSMADVEPAAILTGQVIGHDGATKTARVQHSAGVLTVPFLTAAVGSAVRLRIHARDVALVVGEPGRISIRNRLPATVTALRGTGAMIDVALDIGGDRLVARLTSDAVNDLELREGSSVTALIKAMAVEGFAAERRRSD